MFIYQCTPRSIYAVYKSLIYSIVFKYVFLLFLKKFLCEFPFKIRDESFYFA